MMDALPVEADPVAVAAVALVSALVALRLWAGPTLLDIRFVRFWGVARLIFMPVIDRVAKRLVGVPAENRATREEYVADVDASDKEVVRDLEAGSDRDLEVSVLSGFKTDWDGNREVASVVGYHGPKPFPGAPDFLRRYQVHITLFVTDDGETRITGHREANSWRPDLWRDHLRKGPSFDAADGVRTIEEWLIRSDAEYVDAEA